MKIYKNTCKKANIDSDDIEDLVILLQQAEKLSANLNVFIRFGSKSIYIAYEDEDEDYPDQSLVLAHVIGKINYETVENKIKRERIE